MELIIDYFPYVGFNIDILGEKTNKEFFLTFCFSWFTLMYTMHDIQFYFRINYMQMNLINYIAIEKWTSSQKKCRL